MKKNIPEYITELSKNNFESFEEIFDIKFKKVRQLYWLLCEYSEYITSLDYNESDKNAQEIKKNPPLTEAKDGNTKKMRKCLLLD